MTRERSPKKQTAQTIIQSCVRCGFCTATCPSYLVTGDERDSPRGRIRLIETLLSGQEKDTKQTIAHLDRCLTCNACATACPSHVAYPALIETAREHIEQTGQRSWPDKLFRMLVLNILPYPLRFYYALRLAKLFTWASPLIRIIPLSIAQRTSALLDAAAQAHPHKPSFKSKTKITNPTGQNKPKQTQPIKRVILFEGCAQPVLAPQINAAARALMTRLGIEVITVWGEGCCGALAQHLGHHNRAETCAQKNTNVWSKVHHNHEIDAIVTTTSGCAGQLRQTLKESPQLNTIPLMDICELLMVCRMPEPNPTYADMEIAYHTPCSLTHTLKTPDNGRILLQNAGYKVRDLEENTICCGSAGVYSILEPEISNALKERKKNMIAQTGLRHVASANIGCLTHLAGDPAVTLRHVIEYLDDAYRQ